MNSGTGIGNVTFAQGLEMIQTGVHTKLRMPWWKEDVYVQVNQGTEYMAQDTQMKYLERCSRYGKYPWAPSQEEMFSNKWEVRS